MATRAKQNEHPKGVVVLKTSTLDLIIRAEPSDDAVRDAVRIQTDRYLRGQQGGPASDHPAHRIFNAKRYASEEEFLLGEEPESEIDISDLLPTP